MDSEWESSFSVTFLLQNGCENWYTCPWSGMKHQGSGNGQERSTIHRPQSLFRQERVLLTGAQKTEGRWKGFQADTATKSHSTRVPDKMRHTTIHENRFHPLTDTARKWKDNGCWLSPHWRTSKGNKRDHFLKIWSCGIHGRRMLRWPIVRENLWRSPSKVGTTDQASRGRCSIPFIFRGWKSSRFRQGIKAACSQLLTTDNREVLSPSHHIGGTFQKRSAGH